MSSPYRSPVTRSRTNKKLLLNMNNPKRPNENSSEIQSKFTKIDFDTKIPTKTTQAKKTPSKIIPDKKSPAKETPARMISDQNTPTQNTSTKPSVSLLVQYHDGKQFKINLNTSCGEFNKLFTELEKLKSTDNNGNTPANNFSDTNSPVKIASAKNIQVLKTDQIVPVTPVTKPQECLVDPVIVKTKIFDYSSIPSTSKGTGHNSAEPNYARHDSGLHKLPAEPSLKKGIINGKEYLAIFRGAYIYIDYKVDNDPYATVNIKHYIKALGGRIEKTFSFNVTHVVFRDGFRTTVDTATVRNIPLVSALWVKKSIMSNKLMNPVEYLAINLENYISWPKGSTYKYDLEEFKILTDSDLHVPDEMDIDDLILSECIILMDGIMITPRTQAVIDRQRKLAMETTKQQTSVATSSTASAPNGLKTAESMLLTVVNMLAVHLLNVFNSNRSSQYINKKPICFVKAVKLFKKVLVLDEEEKILSAELDSQLVSIEDYLRLNSKNRLKLRQLLFPSLYP